MTVFFKLKKIDDIIKNFVFFFLNLFVSFKCRMDLFFNLFILSSQSTVLFSFSSSRF